MSEPARPEPTPESTTEPTRPTLEKPIRASDAEREQVAEIVRRAVGDGRLTLVEGDERLSGVYATTHRSELARFTDDLGETAGTAGTAGTAEAAPTPWYRAASPTVERPRTTSSVAVMSGATRQGDWVPGRSHVAVGVMGGVELRLRDAVLGGEDLELHAVAVMGGVEIDLRGADLRGGVTIRAVAIMGGIGVLVDPDTRVEEHGFGFMGAFSDETGSPARPDGPVVRVTGLALMGGVVVQRRRLGIDGEGKPEITEGEERRGIHGGH